MVRASAKQTKVGDHPMEKNVFDGKFSFLVMCPWENADLAIFTEKALILETVKARAKQTKFWYHPMEKNISAKKNFLVLVTIQYILYWIVTSTKKFLTSKTQPWSIVLLVAITWS